MNKTEFEDLISRRAEEIYQDKKRNLLNYLGTYFNREHTEMNAHDCGHSLFQEINTMVNKRIEERKAEIIKKIKQRELDCILNNLDSVRFLFEAANDKED